MLHSDSPNTKNAANEKSLVPNKEFLSASDLARTVLCFYDLKWNNSNFGFFFNYLNFSKTNFLFLHKTVYEGRHAVKLNNGQYREFTQFSHVMFFSNEEFLRYFTEKIYLQTQLYQKTSSFINFFIENLIDVPICFKTSKSLKRGINQLHILKFITLIMKKGKLEKTSRSVINAFQVFLRNREVLQNTNYFVFSKWKSFFRIFYYQYFNNQETMALNLQAPENQNVFFSFIRDFTYLAPIDIEENIENINKILASSKITFFDFKPAVLSKFHSSLELLPNSQYMTDTANFFKNRLISLLGKLLPIFSFFIYNVDKKVRKFSRGRSGKYVFLWKYIAKYKRFRTILKIIAKQIKFYQKKNFTARLLNLFEELALNTPNNFLRHRASFAYNYVFKNCKKTLLTNYKSITS